MAPDIIEHIPMSYEDQDMTKPVGDEHQLTVERTGASRADCIAIICSGIPSPAFRISLSLVVLVSVPVQGRSAFHHQ
jgi:hypothetical protein